MNDADEMARLMAAPWSQAFRVLTPYGLRVSRTLRAHPRRSPAAGGDDGGRATLRALARQDPGLRLRRDSRQRRRGRRDATPSGTKRLAGDDATQEGFRAGAADCIVCAFPLVPRACTPSTSARTRSGGPQAADRAGQLSTSTCKVRVWERKEDACQLPHGGPEHYNCPGCDRRGPGRDPEVLWEQMRPIYSPCWRRGPGRAPAGQDWDCGGPLSKLS